MTICYGIRKNETDWEELGGIAAAKRWLKANPGAEARKVRVWADGTQEDAGEVRASGRNAYRMVGATRQTVAGYR